jgi:NAD(P)-dependent dehydrogenase (short-subunit alcohol dehydrogenase family)
MSQPDAPDSSSRAVSKPAGGPSPENRPLAERVAFVTGASRGIGEAIARRLAADGARVALAARDETTLQRIAREIGDAGGEAVGLGCDVTVPASVSGALGAVAARWKRIDVLVNNAGLGGPTPLTERNDSHWDAILATNVTATFRVIREALPFLSRGARIINMSSVLGRFGVPGFAGYCAAKHGVIGLTRALALELAPREITVNAICPGWVETEMAREGFRRIGGGGAGAEERGREVAAKNAPLGWVLDPEEVAGLAAYLASDVARSVTGQAIVIDGGQVMP